MPDRHSDCTVALKPESCTLPARLADGGVQRDVHYGGRLERGRAARKHEQWQPQQQQQRRQQQDPLHELHHQWDLLAEGPGGRGGSGRARLRKKV
eukprot:365222-Chlamydomonas_euryale.AAC.5